MKHQQVSMLKQQDTDPHRRQYQHNQSAKAVLVPCPAESVAKPENIEAVAKIKNPDEGKWYTNVNIIFKYDI